MTQVSVIMPMRNAGRFVEPAARSVLEQQDVDLELVVVDDGSTDDSVTRVRNLGDARVRIVPGPQAGIAAAFNAGLEACTGRYIARCDADDQFPPQRLAWQVQWLEAHEDFVAVAGSFHMIDEAGRLLAEPLADASALEITDELRRGVARTHLCTFLCRAEALRQIGGCRTWFETAEDLDLQFRLAGLGRVQFEPISAYAYRIHGRSITHKQSDIRRRFFQCTAEQFARQRADEGRDDLERGVPPAVPRRGTGRGATAASHRQSLLLGTAWRYWGDGRRGKAAATALRAVLARPVTLRAWRLLLSILVHRAPQAVASSQGVPKCE